ncbi:hypothetical protein RB195_018847 [Necator americanus]|uniref:Uncharacterized protein n=1 Tax=Necator americanus TaxID=51031 RepID=A0ABR1CBH6_NECAM
MPVSIDKQFKRDVKSQKICGSEDNEWKELSLKLLFLCSPYNDLRRPADATSQGISGANLSMKRLDAYGSFETSTVEELWNLVASKLAATTRDMCLIGVTRILLITPMKICILKSHQRTEGSEAGLRASETVGASPKAPESRALALE